MINLKRVSFSIRLTVIRQSFRARICGANVSSPSANSHNSFWPKRLPKKVFIVACPERANWTDAKIAANFQLHIGFFTYILLLWLSFFCFFFAPTTKTKSRVQLNVECNRKRSINLWRVARSVSTSRVQWKWKWTHADCRRKFFFRYILPVEQWEAGDRASGGRVRAGGPSHWSCDIDKCMRQTQCGNFLDVPTHLRKGH